LICNFSTNSHTCETIAYSASEVLGNELNMKAVVYIRKPLRKSRWRKKNIITLTQKRYLFSAEHGGVRHMKWKFCMLKIFHCQTFR